MLKTLQTIFLLFAIGLHAQETATISGFLRNDATGEPLAYANVFIKSTNLGAASNVEGYYVITNVPPGEYEIAVSIIGLK